MLKKKKARSMRLQLKEIRIKTEKKRVFLKEDSKKKGQAIDAVAKIIKSMITPTEEHLKLQEDFVKIKL